jgi:hypothetical protein
LSRRPTQSKSDVPLRQTAQSLPLTDKVLNRVVIIVLFCVPFLFYWKYLTGSPMLYGSDWLGAGSFAMRDFMARFIRSHGAIAYWMPALLCGQPTGAAFFADLFYPTTLLRLVIPIQVVWTWTFTTHLFLAGLGTYLFLKELNISIIPAALGGLAYSIAGSLITLTYGGHDGRLIGTALMPMALFFLHRGMTRRQFFYFPLVGLILALQLLSGHLQKVYYTGLILVAYFLYMLFVSVRRERSSALALRFSIYFLVAVGLGVTLSAVQYLPVYGNLPFASRGSERGWGYATSWSMPIIETFDLVTPRFSGGLDAYWSRNIFKLHSEYLGIIPLLFACVAVFRRWKERNTKFFTFSFLGALVLAWGGYTPLYYIPYYLFPGISKFRGPAMIFFVAAFSLVALAGLGLDYALRELKKDDARKVTRTMMVAGAVPPVLLVLFGALKGPMLSLLRSTTVPTPEKLAALETNYPNLLGGLLIATAVTALGFLLVRLLFDGRIKPTVFGICLAALMIIDIGVSLSLWDEQRGYIRGVPPPSEYFAPDEATAFLKQDTSLYRVLPWHFQRSDDGILMYNGIQSTGGQLPNPLQTYMDFIGSGTSVFFRPDRLLNPNYMNLANVKYVITLTLPEDASQYDVRTQQEIARIRAYFSQPQFELAFAGRQYSVYRNRKVQPRMYVAGRYELARNKDEVVARLGQPDFNPATTVLLYTDPGITSNGDSIAGAATITRFDCNKIAASVNMTSPGLLVLTENYLPEWQAYDNGRLVPVMQAYHTFRAIPLKSGHHEVEFKYDPKYYEAGAGLSLVAGLFLMGSLGLAWIKSRPRARGHREMEARSAGPAAATKGDAHS